MLVAREAEVSIEGLSHGTYLRLTRGTVTARVSKRSPDEPFVVLTDRAAVKVVGTLFSVDQELGGARRWWCAKGWSR